MDAPFVWFDLTAANGGTVGKFYVELFGWTVGPGQAATGGGSRPRLAVGGTTLVVARSWPDLCSGRGPRRGRGAGRRAGRPCGGSQGLAAHR